MNNRQANNNNNNGRRRGRGGQQQQRSGGGSNQRDNGNRIDNRARGNAAQLLEKYKNLARDAQMQGDRVNTEYYLQFADHYFRVLSETRSRFEENNPGQQQRRPQTDPDDEDFGYGAADTGSDDGNRDDRPQQREDREPREERHARDDRDDGNRREEGRREEGRREEGRRDERPRDERPREESRRNGRSNGNGNGHYQAENQDEGQEPRREARDEEPQGQRRRGNNRPRRDEAPEAETPSGLDLAVLPPAIATDAGSDDAVEEKPRRRGRPRRDADAPAA